MYIHVDLGVGVFSVALERGGRSEKLPNIFLGKDQFASKVWQEQKIHAAGCGYYMKGEDTSRTAEPRTVGESDSLPLCVEFPEYRVVNEPL